jgi:hypothetical protein
VGVFPSALLATVALSLSLLLGGGLTAALAVAALVPSPALALYGRAIRHGGVEPALEEAGTAKPEP